MNREPDVGLRRPPGPDAHRRSARVADGHRLAAVDCRSVPRAWDLHAGDCLHGRVIASVHGVVGLASSPVAVFTFTGEDTEHARRTRIGAAHPEVELGCDDVWRAARAWVRGHGLCEGDAVDLDRLRADVMGAAPQG